MRLKCLLLLNNLIRLIVTEPHDGGNHLGQSLLKSELVNILYNSIELECTYHWLSANHEFKENISQIFVFGWLWQVDAKNGAIFHVRIGLSIISGLFFLYIQHLFKSRILLTAK